MTEPAQELQVVEAQIIPAEKTAWGNTAAKELMKVVKEVGLSRKFGGERAHLYAEAWQILARFSGYHGVVDEPVEIYDIAGIITGFKAQAHVYDRDGREVSRATSMCLRDEPNWKNKPLFQLSSMAQTRALSKAYRLDLGWVAVLAGYSATPAEEMDGVPPAPTIDPPKKTSPRASHEPTEERHTPPGFEDIARIEQLAFETRTPLVSILQAYKVKSLSDLTPKQRLNVVNRLKVKPPRTPNISPDIEPNPDPYAD